MLRTWAVTARKANFKTLDTSPLVSLCPWSVAAPSVLGARALASDTQSAANAEHPADHPNATGPTPKQAKLFQKVLYADYKPPEEVMHPGAAVPVPKAPSTFGRVLGSLGNLIFYGVLVGAIGFAASTYIYSDEQVKQLQKEADEHREDGLAAQAKAIFWEYLRDVREWYSEKVKELTEPSTDVLLPDLMPFQQQLNMRTLVIDLDGVLVESVWQRRHGWKTVKRPGVEAFFETMAQYFEIVVFSDRAHSYVEPILNRIDPGIQTNQGAVIMYRLYRNSTQWRDHENVRDLTKLNRDLSKVIFIVSESHKKNVVPAENVLVIPDFMPPDSDAPQPEQDTTLLDLVPLLELVWKQDVPDTRVVCRSYAGKDVVSEFRRRASAEAAAQSRQSRLSPRLRFGFG